MEVRLSLSFTRRFVQNPKIQWVEGGYYYYCYEAYFVIDRLFVCEKQSSGETDVVSV